MVINENSKAIYLQIADRICDDILDGRLQPEGRLASVRDFAATLQVNANTVMRSYDHLASRGIIANRRGIGYFVSPEARDIVRQDRTEQLLGHDMDDFFRRLLQLGVTPDQLTSAYVKYISDKNENDN